MSFSTKEKEKAYNTRYYLENRETILSRQKKRAKKLSPEEKERLREYKKYKARQYRAQQKALSVAIL